MKKVIILGATGSIGTSVLSVIRNYPDEFDVVGLASRRAGDDMARLAAEFPRAAIALADEPTQQYLKTLKSAGSTNIITGSDAAAQLTASIDADLCIAAISGTAGLPGAFIAAKRGMTVLLANKEVLVSAGELFMTLAKESGATVLPLDSEHAALWQCLEGRDPKQVRQMTITASGGPFWNLPADKMASVRPENALKHPVWSMGAKISIDSATLANKALEVMEARILFGLPRVEVLVHPQSVVHGMVEWNDGSMMAHMGICDMRQPICYMLFYPRPAKWDDARVTLAKVGRLDFFPPDYERFPMLRLGLEAGETGGLTAAYFNAANEEAVGLFLAEEIGFTDIAPIVAKVMKSAPQHKADTMEEVLDAHERASVLTREAAEILV